MPVGRGNNFKSIDLNVVGSSVYGIYPKVSAERTYNLWMSQGFMVPYPGYKIGIPSSNFNGAKEGRALYASVKLNLIFAVFDNMLYQISLTYDHIGATITNSEVSPIGELQTSSGVCYIAENNKPQILISDGTALYVYDMSKTQTTIEATAATSPNHIITLSSYTELDIGDPITFSVSGGGVLPTGLTAGVTYYVSATNFSPDVPSFSLAANPTDAYLGTPRVSFSDVGTAPFYVNTLGPFQKPEIDFVPGYITFHDTYFLCAASSDAYYAPVANNTWRLSAQNNGNLWPDTSQTIGLLETKPDNTQAVVRFPSKGNMILVMGSAVTEFWFDTGAQLFPYQRTNQGSIDYGCLNPATVAFLDEIVIWLAHNEKSGPIIMYTTGGEPEKITTDGIDYQLSEINNPQDAQGFLFRKNGHLFYHLNFYSDNISFVVDINTKKIYNACDQNLNYYAMGQVVWYNNQYFSVTKNDGNFYIFDTIFTTYQWIDKGENVITSEIPRMRICQNIRLPSQDYFIVNDAGFTIESGETNYQMQDRGPIYLHTVSDDQLVTVAHGHDRLITVDGDYLVTMDGDLLITAQESTDVDNLIAMQDDIVSVTPRVDMSISYDGGATFGQDFPYILPGIGYRKNRLMWWQLGIGNDVVFQFKFWGIGRWVCTQGLVNIRQ